MLKGKRFAKLSGVEKSAVLLFCLGEEETAKVFRELDERDVQKISRCMLDMTSVPKAMARDALAAYENAATRQETMFVRGRDFVRRAITGSQAESLFERIDDSGRQPLESLAGLAPRRIATLLQNEHPQTIALVLTTRPADQAARILDHFPKELRSQVLYRIARTEKVPAETLRRIEKVLSRALPCSGEEVTAGGLEKAVDILAAMDKHLENEVLDQINLSDPGLADELKRKMFTFEDLVDLDDRALQALLREISNDRLILALKNCSQAVKDKLFANISSRAAAMIEEDLESMGPVRLSEVEQMQQAIVDTALRLEEEGQIVVRQQPGGDPLV